MKHILMLFTVLLIVSCQHSSDYSKSAELNNAAIDLLEAKNYDGALDGFKEALTHPVSEELLPQVYRNISICYYFLGEADSSKVYVKKALEASPKNSYLYFLNKGEWELTNQRVRAAEKAFLAALEVDDKRMEAYNNLTLIYDGSYGEEYVDLEKALSFAKETYKRNPSPTIKEQLASVYFDLENYPEALRLYKELMTRFPEVKMYQLEYGMTLYFSGVEEEGIRLMQEAAERDAACRLAFDQLFE